MFSYFKFLICLLLLCFSTFAHNPRLKPSIEKKDLQICSFFRYIPLKVAGADNDAVTIQRNILSNSCIAVLSLGLATVSNSLRTLFPII